MNWVNQSPTVSFISVILKLENWNFCSMTSLGSRRIKRLPEQRGFCEGKWEKEKHWKDWAHSHFQGSFPGLGQFQGCGSHRFSGCHHFTCLFMMWGDTWVKFSAAVCQREGMLHSRHRSHHTHSFNPSGFTSNVSWQGEVGQKSSWGHGREEKNALIK